MTRLSRHRGPALALAIAALGGCARKEVPPPVAVAVDAGPPLAKKPADHLAPGELVEGTEKVFGLTIPKLMHVDRRFDDLVFVSGPVDPNLVTKYVEARVRNGSVKQVGNDQVFEKVNAIGETRPLKITVAKGTTGTGTSMQLRDVTPPPQVALPDEEARWRAVGLKPNGEPLDKTKLR